MTELPRQTSSDLRVLGLFGDGVWRRIEVPAHLPRRAGADSLDELLRWRSSTATFDRVWMPDADEWAMVALGRLLAYREVETWDA